MRPEVLVGSGGARGSHGVECIIDLLLQLRGERISSLILEDREGVLQELTAFDDLRGGERGVA